jgi:hypothetical protein
MNTRKDNIKAYYSKKYYEEKTKKESIKKAKELTNRRNINIKYILWERLVSRTRNTYKNPYNLDYKVLIGCNEDELFEYIKNIIKLPLIIENYNEWHLDHIIGICNWNLENIDEVKKCFHYSNIQILSVKDNLTKKKYIK